ncbi:hypothetical protein D3C87_2019450 [compost metagenome]
MTTIKAVTTRPIKPQINRLVPVISMPATVPMEPQPIVIDVARARPPTDRTPVAISPL